MKTNTIAPIAEPTRTRTRAANSVAVKPTIPDEVKALAATFFRENAICNAAKKKADTAREELLARMTQLNLKTFDCEAMTADGKSAIPLTAVIGARESEGMDCARLRTQVADDVFMRCVSATKKAVESQAGAAVAAACAVTKVGEENVSVKIRK